MGWAAGDLPKVEKAKIELSLAKATLYNLSRTIKSIGHEEKREFMQKSMQEIDSGINTIEMDLNR